MNHTDKGSPKQTSIDSSEPLLKCDKQVRQEVNRKSAVKCRLKKKAAQEQMKADMAQLRVDNDTLRDQLNGLTAKLFDQSE